jgi:3-deoxy-D-manno-octulosonic-acid transferase
LPKAGLWAYGLKKQSDVNVLLYRFAITVFALSMLFRGQIAARFGIAPRKAPPQKPEAPPHIWLHGASNGELASVGPVLTRLMAARPDLHWLITANTQTGVDMVRGWGLERVCVQLAPVDLAWVGRRIMRRWNVVAHISLESELWPNRVLSCPGPVILLGARMSAGTARSWARLPRLAKHVLSRVSYVSTQDGASLGRLFDLGLPRTAGGSIVDLKAFYARPETQIPDDLSQAFDRTQTWLAASTHEGEEEIVLAAHLEALKSMPGLRLILAPRHPRRAEAIARQVHARGLTLAQRSRSDAPQAEVYLADTMGEMALWYALAGRVFIGGTLTDRGGHTPYEPAAFGCALIHGPDTRNFAASFARLAETRSALEIGTASDLSAALAALADPNAQTELAQSATLALQQDASLGDLVAEIHEALVRIKSA